MKKAGIVIAFCVILGCSIMDKSMANDLLSNTRIIFASGAVAGNYLGTEDIFLKNLSPFDKSSRMKTGRKVNDSEFLQYISEQSRDWTAAEEEKINGIMFRINSTLSEYNMVFPGEIVFIKTTGLEEGNAAYCRANNIIVLPADYVDLPADILYDTIVHELFHIFSRNNSRTQEKLYEVLSFRKCGELRLPDEIFQWKITNPDAAINNYFFSLRINGRDYSLMPVLLASSEYDERKGGEFFDYLELYFIAITENGDYTYPLIENNRFILFTINQVPDYIRLVGRNTDYIIHPEEVLASNFVFLINKTRNLPNMEIIEKMAEILKTQW